MKILPRLVVHWLFTYLLILLVSLLFLFSISAVAFHTGRDLLEHSHEVSIRHFRAELDSLLGDIQSIDANLRRFEQEPLLSTFLLGFDHAKVLERSRIQDMLMALRFDTEALDVFAVTNEGIIAAGEYFQRAEFYNKYLRGSELSVEQWYAFLDELTAERYLHIDTTTHLGERFHHLLYYSNLSGGGMSVLVLLDLEAVMGKIKRNAWLSEADVRVIDHFGTPLVEFGDTSDWPSLDASFYTGDRAIEIDQYVYQWEDSRELNWRIVSRFRQETYNKPALFIRRLSIVGFLSLLIVGSGLALWLAFREYRPVRRILSVLSDAPAGDHADYEEIFERVDQLVQTNRSVSEQLEQQEAVLLRSALSRALLGAHERDPVDALLPLVSHGVGPVGAAGGIIIALAEITGDNRERYRKRKVFEYLDHLNAATIEISDTDVWWTNVEGLPTGLVLLHAPVSADEFASFVRRRIYPLIEHTFAISMTLAISAPFRALQSTDQLEKAWQEAREAIEYRTVFGSDTVIDYRALDDRLGGVRPYGDLGTEDRLVNSVKAADYASSRRIVAKAVARMERSRLAPEYAEIRLHAMIQLLVNVLGEIRGDIGDAPLDEIDAERSVAQAVSLQELRHRADRVFAHVVEYCAVHRTRSDSEVDHYIINHLASPHLSVGAIAEAFDESISGLSSRYKEQTGHSVLDTIRRMRVERAVTIMREEAGVSLTTIAHRVGYRNEVALRRAFRHVTGITPHEYRRSCI